MYKESKIPYSTSWLGVEREGEKYALNWALERLVLLLRDITRDGIVYPTHAVYYSHHTNTCSVRMYFSEGGVILN